MVKKAMERALPHLIAAVLALALLGGAAWWLSLPAAKPPAPAPVQAIQAPKPVSAIPAGWRAIAVPDAFTVQAPPGTVFAPGRGTDSLTGKISGPGFDLQFDYGVWSSDLGFAKSAKGYSETDVTLDGRDLVIRHATGIDAKQGGSAGEPYFVGLYVPMTQQQTGQDYPVKLSIAGFARTPGDAATIERIYRTIKFAGLPP